MGTVRQDWMPVEDDRLRAYAESYTPAQLAEMLLRPEISVRHRLYRLGLTALPTRQTWTALELRRLRAWFPIKTRTEIANLLGKSVYAVNAEMRRQGLTEARTERESDREDDARVERLMALACRIRPQRPTGGSQCAV